LLWNVGSHRARAVPLWILPPQVSRMGWHGGAAPTERQPSGDAGALWTRAVPLWAEPENQSGPPRGDGPYGVVQIL
jgi:hypothetical protein